MKRGLTLALCAVPLCAVSLACGPSKPPAPPPISKPEPAAPAPAGPDPWAVEGELAREKLPEGMPEVALEKRAFPDRPPGVPKPPKRCGAFLSRAAEAGACTDRDAALASLEAALSTTEPDRRDAMLHGLERCQHLPAGVPRALRIELAPIGCADALARPFLAEVPPDVEGVVYDTVFGLGLSGMLTRTANDPPEPPPPHDEASLERFTVGPMKQWIKEQATAIQRLADLGSELGYYGRAVVAVESGMAEMRFIDAVRQVPVPEEYREDEELEEAYYQGLERALEPRKRRGRDAALVGLGSMATIGLLRDERVARTRALLSRMYGGAPIDALDALLLPPLSPVEPETTEERLASRLQTFYASLVFPAERATPLLRMLIERGVSLPHRIALRDVELDDETRALYGRARFELGQTYWRRIDFDEAIALLQGAEQLDEASRLVLATAIALHGGPANAAEMMVKAPVDELGIGDVAALDALASEDGPHAGMAAYNAATISRLSAPADGSAAYWKRVASRYEDAAAQLEDVRYQRRARERAEEARQTAAAIEARD